MRERVSRKLNWIKISTRMLRMTKNIEFYRVFDRNRPIETIDGYDKRSRCDPPPLHQSRYNASLLSTCVMIAGGARVHSIEARQSIAQPDPTLSIAPRHLHQKKLHGT